MELIIREYEDCTFVTCGNALLLCDRFEIVDEEDYRFCRGYVAERKAFQILIEERDRVEIYPKRIFNNDTEK